MDNWIIPGAIFVVAALGGLVKLCIWFGEVNADRASFKKFMEEIRKDVKEILGRLQPKTVAGGSPVTLTELGKKISEEVDAKAWAARTAEQIKESVKGKQPYEIHDFCNEFIRLRYHFTDELERLIKSSAYENAVNRDQVLNVLAVELRDKLLELVN